MKKQALFCALLLAMSLAAISESFAGPQDFTLVNLTGVTIRYLYVSHANDDYWGRDLLGSEVMPSGTSREITFYNSYDNRRYWDLKIIDAYGNSYVWEDFDLVRISTITLYISNGQMRARYN